MPRMPARGAAFEVSEDDQVFQLAKPKVERTLQQLAAASQDALPATLRNIRNDIIGSQRKKLVYLKLGLLPRVMSLLSDRPDEETTVQLYTILGSLASGPKLIVHALVECRVPSELVAALATESVRVLRAALRALKSLLHSPAVAKSPLVVDSVLNRLKTLLLHHCPIVFDGAASCLARICRSSDAPEKRAARQDAVYRMDVAGTIMQRMEAPHSKEVDSALELLGELVCCNERLAGLLLTPPDLLLSLFSLTTRPRVQTRLLAAKCIGFVFKYPRAELAEYQGWLRATLIRLKALLLESAPLETYTQACEVIAPFLLIQPRLQVESEDIIPPLIDFLTNKTYEEAPLSFKEAALTCLTALCDTCEENRQVLTPHLATFISLVFSEETELKLASCRLLAAYTRSSVANRSPLLGNRLPGRLLVLMSDDDEAVVLAACALSCNLLVEFFPWKKTYVEAGLPQRLVALLASPNAHIREKASCAIANLCYMATPELKRLALELLPIPALLKLSHDDSDIVRVNALNIFRNILHGNKELAQSPEQILPFVSFLEQCFKRGARVVDIPHSLLTALLGCLTNTAALSHVVKDELCKPDLLNRLSAIMELGTTDLVEMAFQVINNLAWPDTINCLDRITTMRQTNLMRVLADISRPSTEHKAAVRCSADSCLRRLLGGS